MRKKECSSIEEMARIVIELIIKKLNSQDQEDVHVAFSGGNTPIEMFKLWAEEYVDKTDWDRLLIYWVDERCVPASSEESNYGNMKRNLLEKVPIDINNVFPIDGTNDPEVEASRYEHLMKSCLGWNEEMTERKKLDLVILGAGNDGHTSSIFPGEEHLLTASEWYLNSVNPYSKQDRVGMTAQGILEAQEVIFMIAGENKRSVLEDIFTGRNNGAAANVATRAENCTILYSL